MVTTASSDHSEIWKKLSLYLCLVSFSIIHRIFRVFIRSNDLCIIAKLGLTVCVCLCRCGVEGRSQAAHYYNYLYDYRRHCDDYYY